MLAPTSSLCSLHTQTHIHRPISSPSTGHPPPSSPQLHCSPSAGCALVSQPASDPEEIKGFLASNINGGGVCRSNNNANKYLRYPCRVKGVPICNCPSGYVCNIGCVSMPANSQLPLAHCKTARAAAAGQKQHTKQCNDAAHRPAAVLLSPAGTTRPSGMMASPAKCRSVRRHCTACMRLLAIMKAEKLPQQRAARCCFRAARALPHAAANFHIYNNKLTAPCAGTGGDTFCVVGRESPGPATKLLAQGRRVHGMRLPCVLANSAIQASPAVMLTLPLPVALQAA